MMCGTEEQEGSIDVTLYGDELTEIDPMVWPNGHFILDIFQKQGVIDLDHQRAHQADPEYWQACARRALLLKFGYLTDDDSDNFDISSVQKSWGEVVQKILERRKDGSFDSNRRDDLLDFLNSSCKSSNSRTLHWSAMKFGPGCQWNLHAHPNIELIYCTQGAIHEIRMNGEPLTETFAGAENEELKAPDLTDLKRPWSFATLAAGHWLVNEVGSVHKTFTSTAGTGCQLLVLRSSYVDIENPPASVKNVNDAVDRIDSRLKRTYGESCNGDCTNWDKISETFLPESEKSRWPQQ